LPSVMVGDKAGMSTSMGMTFLLTAKCLSAGDAEEKNSN
jgi:hypothetical protein